MSKRFGRNQKRRLREQLAQSQVNQKQLEQRLEMQQIASRPGTLTFFNIGAAGFKGGFDGGFLHKHHHLHEMTVSKGNCFDPSKTIFVVSVDGHQAAQVFVNKDLMRVADRGDLEPLCRRIAQDLIKMIRQQLGE